MIKWNKHKKPSTSYWMSNICKKNQESSFQYAEIWDYTFNDKNGINTSKQGTKHTKTWDEFQFNFLVHIIWIIILES